MVLEKSWDWKTLIIYVLLAIIIMLLSKKSIESKCQNKKISFKKFNIEEKYLYYFIIYTIFIIFSTFRVVSDGIGGTDTITYMEQFEKIKYVRFFSISNLTFNDYEYFYYNLMFIVKLFGGSYINFEFLIHSAIIISYIYLIDKNFDDSKSSIIIILFFIPLLKSLNIIRNCFAAAICCIGLEKIKNNKWLTGILFVLIAFLSHYLAIIMFAYLIFYKLFPDKYINKKTEISLPFVCCLIGFVGMPIIKALIEHSGFSGYLNKIQISLIGYIPIYALYLLMIFTNKFQEYIIRKGHYIYFKSHIFFMSVLPITIMVGAASRLMLFFEIPKYIIYSDLYLVYREKVKNKKIYDALIFLFLIIWLIFRIYRMWNGYSLMPYKNKIFNY